MKSKHLTALEIILFLVGIILILCGILLVFLLPESTRTAWIPGVCFGVATSLLAAVVFAKFHASISQSEQVAQMAQMISVQLSQDVNKTLQGLNDQNFVKLQKLEGDQQQAIIDFFQQRDFTHFKATDHKEREFKDFVEGALRNTTLYYFRGVAGTYVPERVAQLKEGTSCKVLLVDPRSRDLVRLYATARTKSGETELEGEMRIKWLIEGTYLTIVQLFDLAAIRTVDVQICNAPVANRLEIFDRHALVSYFSTNVRTVFPDSCFYPKENFFYHAFLTEFEQTSKIATTRTDLNSLNPQTLSHFLSSIGCDVVWPNKSIEDLRQVAMERAEEEQDRRRRRDLRPSLAS